ncbi:MAG: Twin-arginine translocation protein, TatA/E family subunit [Thermoplasmatales archaeon I-plasma]|jgi:sec-independent protein translocase protein TatA|nr:MAG: Twin-arginine translocation protein, TatA/E family subunit [Thermoplasmatales archaeon I-plasma]
MQMQMIGSPTDWIILIVVVLLVLGGTKKIPEMAKAMGRAMGEFRKGRMEVEKEINEALKTDNAPQAPQK